MPDKEMAGDPSEARFRALLPEPPPEPCGDMAAYEDMLTGARARDWQARLVAKLYEHIARLEARIETLEARLNGSRD